MANGMNESEMREAILAFADGELDADAARALLEQIADDPQVLRQALHQHQLRQAVGRVMSDRPSAPDALRAKLIAMAANDAGSDPSPSESIRFEEQRPTVLARIGRWVPAAVAAVLLIGALAVYNQLINEQQSEVSIVPAARIAAFEMRHMRCSRMIDTLHADATLPQQINALPAALAQRFGTSPPGLDLSAVGYSFQRVGPCTIPGDNALHLIYESTNDTGHDLAMSLWIVPYTGQPQLDDGRVVQVVSPDHAHPIILWRDGQMLYYLCGDEPESMQRAVDLLREHA